MNFNVEWTGTGSYNLDHFWHGSTRRDSEGENSHIWRIGLDLWI